MARTGAGGHTRFAVVNNMQNTSALNVFNGSDGDTDIEITTEFQ